MNNLLDEQEKKHEQFSPIKFEKGVEKYTSRSCIVIAVLIGLLFGGFVLICLSISRANF